MDINYIIALEVFVFLGCIGGIIVGKKYFKAKGYAFNLFWWGIAQFPLMMIFAIDQKWDIYPYDFHGYDTTTIWFAATMLYGSALCFYMSLGVWKGELRNDYGPDGKYLLPVFSIILLLIFLSYILTPGGLKY